MINIIYIHKTILFFLFFLIIVNKNIIIVCIYNIQYQC